MVRIYSMHGWGRKMIHIKLRSEKTGHSQDLGRDGRIIIIFIIRKQSGMVWTSVIWFRIKNSGGPL